MDDEYVAQLLAKEAKESSLKYSSQGLSALMPASKPASNAPKPNTRFLRNLIKVTDSHNTALKQKEEREARERMRQMKAQASGASASTSTDRTAGRSDRRNERRSDDKDDHHRSYRRRYRSHSPTERDRTRRHRRDEDHEKGEHRHRERDDYRRESREHETARKDRRERDRDRDREHTRRRRDRSYSKSQSRSRSPRRDRSTDRHRHRRRRTDRQSDRYKRSRSRSRSRSEERRKSRSSRHADPSPRRSRPDSTRRDRSPPPLKAITTETGDESDPLEDLVGPLPPRKNEAPIRSRGRGAYKPNMSNIDAHFAPGYDPTTDVHLEENMHPDGEPSRRPVAGLMTKDDDWDMALEALRDRTRWKQKGEERLRAAGINEEAIHQWKNNAAFTGADGEGKPEDVQWSKKGEGREWDRGKFVNDDGHIDIRAAW
ncbi:hypothetical protein N7452_007246 [Penicillium brevicompactum]|uniref:Pre-mRNA-splicing factor 38B n=1 Tax=Penicillium brevicompactum TaxID=5074 RepID=A0A9W9UFK5_PENBR|nr:hypothetical protein N7452_007246 [Penicillium brevicompactum]